MRYPVQFVTPEEAFGVDVKLEIELQDAPADGPVVLPDCPDCEECEECPECPGACEPVCTHWSLMIVGAIAVAEPTVIAAEYTTVYGATGETKNFNAWTHTRPGQPALSGAFWGIQIHAVPIADRCGHKTRFVIDNSAGAGKITATEIYNDDDTFSLGNDSQESVLVSVAKTSGTGTPHVSVQMQIDLTDDDMGWTNLGPAINFKNT